MKIFTAGTGAVDNTAQKIGSVDHWNENLSHYKNILNQFHWLNLEQLCAFSGGFMGDK